MATIRSSPAAETRRVPDADTQPQEPTRPISTPPAGLPLAVHLAGLVVLASVMGVDPGGWRPFEYAKWCAVALAVVAAWTALAFTTRSPLPRWFRLMGTALLALFIVAAIVGRDPIYAWTGTPERQMGVATWLLFAATCSVGTVLNSPARRRVFARWVVVALGWANLYSAVEYFGWRPITINTDTSRVTGPYGSAALFGAALCLLVPVVLGLAADRDEVGPWRYGAALAATLGIATTAMTGTRAAWVGLTIGGALWIVVAVSPQRGLSSRRGSWRTWMPVVAGLALGVVGLAASSEVTQRTAGATSRFAEWGVGWRLLIAHPWLGAGPEGYRTALASGVTASYERTYGRTVTPDRAHNALLDVGAAGGLLAAVLYAALIAVVVYAAWRILRSPDRTPVAAGFAIAAVAYLAQQQFLFPLSTVDPVLWILVGSIVVTAWPSIPTGPCLERRRTIRLTIGALAMVVLFINGVFALAADRAARRAIDERDLASAERAVQLRPDVVRYRLLAAQLEPQTITGQRAAVDQTAQALKVSPRDPIVLQAHGDALLRLAISTHDPGDVSRALDVWQQLSRDDVNCYHCALALGYTNVLNEDGKQAAIDAFRRASELAPAGSAEAEQALEQLLARPTPTPVAPPAMGDTSSTDAGTVHAG